MAIDPLRSLLRAWGRLDEALALLGKQRVLCLELGNKEGLERSYSNEALIRILQGDLAEAQALLQQAEAICIEVGLKPNLGHCYWHSAILECARGDRTAQKQKLQQALTIFTELKMHRDRDDVQAELDELTSAKKSHIKPKMNAKPLKKPRTASKKRKKRK